MKKAFTILAGLALLCSCEKEPVPEVVEQKPKTYLITEGKQWAHYITQTWNEEKPYSTTTFRIQGDTIINGKTYKKVWWSQEEDLSDLRPFPNLYMREEKGKVYELSGNDPEKLWFDYTAQVGDTLCFDQGDAYGVEATYGIVTSIDEVVLENSDGELRKRYEVRLGKGLAGFDKGYDLYVYEDIGVINSPSNGYGLSGHTLFNYGSRRVLLYVHGVDKILYRSEEGWYKK